MSKHHGLYKFVTCDTNEIIYIGKTNNNLKSRVKDHIRGKGVDEKFNAYKNNYKVYVSFLPNKVETDIMERALINKYKPVLNVVDKYDGLSNLIKVEEPQWVEYEKVLPEIEPDNPSKQKKAFLDDIFIGKIDETDYYLTNTYHVKENGKRIDKQFFYNTDEALEYIKYIVNLCEEYGVYCEERKEYIVPAQCFQRYASFFFQNQTLGSGLITRTKKYTECSSIISSMSGKKNVLEKITLDQPSIDVCKTIIDKLIIIVAA